MIAIQEAKHIFYHNIWVPVFETGLQPSISFTFAHFDFVVDIPDISDFRLLNEVWLKGACLPFIILLFSLSPKKMMKVWG